MPFPDLLKNNPKYIFFTDFDGTITLEDTNFYMVDHYGFGPERRAQTNKAILDGGISYREGFQEMMDSIQTPYPELLQAIAQNVPLDQGFQRFLTWARTVNIPVAITTAGIIPLVRRQLAGLMGREEAAAIEVEGNGIEARPGKTLDEVGGWRLKYHDSSTHGHDKSLAIRPYAAAIRELPAEERPVLLYAGDGVSDVSAAREADLLFAKRGLELATYCDRNGIHYVPFNDWDDIYETVENIHHAELDAGTVIRQMKNHRTG